MRATDIWKSDIGAQAAWKGFTSQTLYIANRLLSDNDGYKFYPEDVEDLIINICCFNLQHGLYPCEGRKF